MKTKDGRFIEKRVMLEHPKISNILDETCKHQDLNVGGISKLLEVSEKTLIINWIQRNHTIPLSIFKKLIKLHPKLNLSSSELKFKILNCYWGQGKGARPIRYKKVNFPNTPSEDFAEFYGIMLGDGCIYSNYNGIAICCDSLLDKEYIDYHIPNLMKKLFGVYPKIYDDTPKFKRVKKCVLYSKKLTKFLEAQGLVRGYKKEGKTIIPPNFFSNKKLLTKCIRGLFDTDGSICPHPHTSVMIDITIKIPSLLESTIKAFEVLGVKAGHSKKAILIYGPDKVKDYFEKIGSSNSKHVIKYDNFVLTGKVPRSKEMETFLREYWDFSPSR